MGVIAVNVRHRNVTLRGFRMHYVEVGAGSPLLFLHGWPQSWYEWRKVLPDVSKRFHAIAPDLRGLGDSERPLDGYDKRSLAFDIVALLDALGLERVGLVAHDWGGAVACEVCREVPERISRLLVWDMVPEIVRADRPLPLEIGKRLWHIFFHGGHPDLAVDLVSRDIEAYLRHFLTTPPYVYDPTTFSPEDVAEYVRVNSAPGALRAGFQYYATALREDAERWSRRTGKIRTPVRAFGGANFLGDVTPYWREVAENVEGGVVEECGHFVPEEKPEIVVRQIVDFFGAGA